MSTPQPITEKELRRSRAGKAGKTATKPVAKKQASAKPAVSKGALVVHKPKLLTQPKTLLQACAEAARDPRVEVGKLKELLAMAHDEETRAAEKMFNAAMYAAQSEMPKVIRDAFNPHTKSRYPKLETLSQTVDPVARQHGFVLTYGTSDSPLDDHYRVICDVTHVPSGFTRRYLADIGSDVVGAKGGGTKSGAQGSGSSISYGRRYIKVLIFDLVIVGEDTDAQGRPVGPLSEKELRELRSLMAEKAVSDAQFEAAFLCLPDNLPKRRLQEALDRIGQRPTPSTKRKEEVEAQ